MLRPVARSIARSKAPLPLIARRTQASIASASERALQPSEATPSDDAEVRSPRSLQALHLKPLRRVAEHGVPSCDLQLRSYNVQPLEFFSDFALRAAYYLGLPAYGPVPLPRITERWTVPRSHFIFKKQQENFERVTRRRLIQIKDGHPETVQLWLAYLRKHAFYGIGMKANVWEYGPMGEGKTIELSEEQLRALEPAWEHLGQAHKMPSADKVDEILSSRKFRQAMAWQEDPTSKPFEAPKGWDEAAGVVRRQPQKKK